MTRPVTVSYSSPWPIPRRAWPLGSAANPRYGLLEPERMAMASSTEALRNVVAVGGDPARTSLLDNFSWGNCKKPEQLGALVKAARGCYAAAKAFGTPFISGKDSLNNDYRVGRSVPFDPPTLYLSSMSVVPNVVNCVTMDVKRRATCCYWSDSPRPNSGAPSTWPRWVSRRRGALSRLGHGTPDLHQAARRP